MNAAGPPLGAVRHGEAFLASLAAPDEPRQRWHRPLDLADVVPPDLYALVRSRYLPLVRRVLERRRVYLGPDVSVQFENRATAVYHLHESLRADGIWSARHVADAVADHGRLVPAPDQLVATVMVHGGDRADRVCEALARQGALHLQLASRAIEGRSLDESDPRYPVHYVAFELGEDDWRALARGPGPHSLVLCDGEAASVAAPVPPAVRRALVDDRY